MAGGICAVYGCNNYHVKNSSKSFFSFPRDITRAALWALWAFPNCDVSMEYLQQLNTSNLYICSNHFSNDSFIEHNKNHLSRSCVPNGALPANQEEARKSIMGKLLGTGNTKKIEERERELPSQIPKYSNEPLPSCSGADSEINAGTDTVLPTVELETCSTTNLDDMCVTPTTFNQNDTTFSAEQFISCSSVNTEDNRSTLSPVFMNTDEVTDEICTTPTTSKIPREQRSISSRKKGKGRKRLLSGINVTRVAQLTPKAQALHSQCRKYSKKLVDLQKKYKDLKLKGKEKLERLSEDDTIDELCKKMRPAAAIMLRSQIKCADKKPKGRRWTREEKLLALSIYKKSPSCYRLLRKLFVLPAPSCVKKLLSSIPLSTGICSVLFSSVANSVKKMKKGDENCVLMFDEIGIRRHVSYDRKRDKINGYEDHGSSHGTGRGLTSQVMVFMVVGLRRKWKQPIAYYFSSGNMSSSRLHVIIKDVLRACFSVGLNVLGTVCDMGTNNVAALNCLKSSPQDAYFKFNDERIAVIYDPPHLLKTFRNNFQKYDVTFDVQSNIANLHQKGVARWSHIKALYDYDQQTQFQCARKLTESHMKPNTKQSMKVSYAAQVLSHTVSAALFALHKFGGSFAGAEVTAHLVKNMDVLFDSFNGVYSKKLSKKKVTNMAAKKNADGIQGAITIKSKHLELWGEQKKIIKNMKFETPSGRQPPSKDGWIMSMNGAELVWKTVQSLGFSYLETRRLNQDPLENFFGSVRSSCGCNNNPTTEQFVGSFKSNLLTGLVFDDLYRGNCENDDLFLLDNLQSLLDPLDEVDMQLGPLAESPNSKKVLAFTRKDLEDTNYATAYVSGFVVRRVLELHACIKQCEDCMAQLTSSMVDENNRFIFFKEYTVDKERLSYPSYNFCNVVSGCTAFIESFLDSNSHISDIKETVISLLREENYFDELKCHIHKDLYVTAVLDTVFYVAVKKWCKYFNMKLLRVEKEKAMQRKLKILKGM